MIIERSFENGRLPSEPELSRQLGASRATVRQALSALATEGLIVRKHGVGTFVDDRVLHISTRIEEVWDFAEMIKVSGYAPGVRHIELRLEPGDQDINQKLGLDPAAEIITTANVFLADGLPAIYCIDKIPAYLVNRAYRDEELHGPVYSFLQKRCDQRLDHNITQILPVVADPELSRLLEYPVGSPLHYFEEIGINNLGTPIIYSEVYYRPDYFAFHVIRKMTSTYQNLSK
jgi:GntR family transcriptional regulator